MSLAALCLPVLVPGPGAAETSANGLVAYTRGVDADADGIFRGGSAEELTTDVYMQAAEAGAVATLVNEPNDTADITPSFSPDGTRIAWASNAAGSFDIMVKDLRTGVVTNLTRTGKGVNERWPNWSSDGREIVYNRRSGRNNLDVWVMEADGTKPRYLTGLRGPGKYAEDCCASFSPDDDSVVFASNRAGNFDLYRFDRHGHGSGGPGRLVRLTSSRFYEGTPAFEAGGTVLFRSSDGQKIHRLDPFDASMGATRIATDGLARTPAGSPDGTMIVFGSIAAPGAQLDVAIADARGGNQVLLTRTPRLSETDPTWQPRG